MHNTARHQQGLSLCFPRIDTLDVSIVSGSECSILHHQSMPTASDGCAGLADDPTRRVASRTTDHTLDSLSGIHITDF